MSQGKSHYTVTSVNKIRENLKKLITRKARHRQDENGIITQIPSLIALTVKGVKYLVAKRVTGAWKLLKSMMAWLKKGDHRWPGKKDVQDGSFWPERGDERERLGEKI
jgi:hypothetical protein